MEDKRVPVEAEVHEIPEDREPVFPENFYGTSTKPRRQRDRSWILICVSLVMIVGSTFYIVSTLLRYRIEKQNENWVISAQIPETTPPAEETIQRLEVSAEDLFISPSGEKTGSVELHLATVERERLTPKEVYALVSPAVVCVQMETYYGLYFCTGVVISEDGYILTATDAQTNAAVLTVSFPDGSQYAADCVREEWGSGLSLLKIEAKELPTVTFAQDNDLSVGEEVFCVCNPYGSQIPNVFYEGMMSAVGTVQVENYTYTVLQSSAQRSGVGYGCPILNDQGLVVGLTSPIGKRIVSDQDPCFAVSAPDLTEILAAFERAETSESRWLGLVVSEIPEEYLFFFNFPGKLWISETPRYPALCKYDVVISVDGTEVNSLEEFEKLVSAHEPGDLVELILFRNDTLYRAILPVFAR